MRILMLSQFYPPFIGGEEQHVHSLSTQLVSRGHDVAVVTLWHQGLAEFELDEGVRVYRIRSLMQSIPWLYSDGKRRYAPPFPDPAILRVLRRIIVQERPEIVHGHNWLVHSFLPLKAWSRARLVITLHNYNLVCANLGFLYQGARCNGPGMTKCLGCATQHYGVIKGIPTVLGNWVMGLTERSAVDMFLPVSRAVAVGSNLASSRLPFQVIPNFIPDDIETPQDNPEPYLAQLPSEDYLLFVGALARFKGVDVLLRAYAGLTDAPPLVLIGYETPDWSLPARDHPHNVFLLKNWPHYAVMQAWRRSVIALAPSKIPDSCPTVAMEAMIMGKPIIASHTGGLVDLVADGETGFLVPPGDPSALQQAIERLLTNPNLRSRMGQAALRKVVEFQASTVVPRIEHVYEQVLA